MGKGSSPRPRLVGRHEYDLRWKYALGYITFKQFEKCLKRIKKEQSNVQSGTT